MLCARRPPTAACPPPSLRSLNVHGRDVQDRRDVALLRSDEDDQSNPRTDETCASAACAAFIASMTDDAMQDISTGFGTCTGPFANLRSRCGRHRWLFGSCCARDGLRRPALRALSAFVARARARCPRWARCRPLAETTTRTIKAILALMRRAHRRVCGLRQRITDEPHDVNGLATCTGPFAGSQVYGAGGMYEGYLAHVVRATASDCGLPSALSPLSLSTCMGAMSKIGEMSSSCGDDDDDQSNPRTDETCASPVCGLHRKHDRRRLAGDGHWLCHVQRHQAAFQAYGWGIESYLRKTASDCGPPSALSPLLSTCAGAMSRWARCPLLRRGRRRRRRRSKQSSH